MECSNWRGITILNVVNKVIAQVLHHRIFKVLEQNMRPEQAGFRPNKSCIDHINSLRVIVEQSAEMRAPLYLIFIDFERAFDCLDQSAIWKVLRCYGVPEKMIRLIKALYDDAKCLVLHEGLKSNHISVKTGVRQGCILSPLLFNLVLDAIMRQSISTNNGIHLGLQTRLNDLDYADDICLLSQSYSELQQKINNISLNAAKVGLKINIRKTKSMRLNTNNEQPFKLLDKPLDDVESFCYLGSIIDKSGGSSADILNRIIKATQAFGALDRIWRSSNISVRTKIKLFNSNVKSTLLYGCETWNLTCQEAQTIQSFVNRCLRRILKIFWPNTISNDELWFKTRQPMIVQTIKLRKYGWIGHTLRKPSTDITRKALDFNPQGSRRRGRPRNTWRRNVKNELMSENTTWEQMKAIAQDRVRWNSFVTALCSF